MRTLLAVILFFGITATANAGEFKLSGELTQGGLVFGWATPGAKITLDGSIITQAKTGDFLLGFSRKAKEQAHLNIRFADGGIATRELSIAQRKYDIQRINGIARRKVTPNPEDLARIKAERSLINKSREIEIAEPLFTVGFIKPVEGRISGVYGSQRILNGQPRRPHLGLDIAAPEGTELKAASAGVIVFVHPGMFFNGKTVIVHHGMGLRSTYIHMKTISVKEGQRVAKGDVVGQVGKTGRATGPHLHWGLQLNKTPLDPMKLFQ